MNYLKFLRFKNGYKQSDVADQTNIGKNKIVRAEKNDKLIVNGFTYSQLESLAQFYNMTVDELINDYRNGPDVNELRRV